MSQPALVLPAGIRAEILAHLQACLPEEACGILGGLGNTITLALPVENELHSPVRFRMRPADQVRVFQTLESLGLEMLAIWHSHPAGPAGLSATDLSEAYYPEAALLVASPDPDAQANAGPSSAWRLRAFRLVEGCPVEISLQVS